MLSPPVSVGAVAARQVIADLRAALEGSASVHSDPYGVGSVRPSGVTRSSNRVRPPFHDDSRSSTASALGCVDLVNDTTLVEVTYRLDDTGRQGDAYLAAEFEVAR